MSWIFLELKIKHTCTHKGRKDFISAQLLYLNNPGSDMPATGEWRSHAMQDMNDKNIVHSSLGREYYSKINSFLVSLKMLDAK